MNDKNYLQSYLIEEYIEDYMQQRINRRQALGHIATITGSLITAAVFLNNCSPLAQTPQNLATTPNLSPLENNLGDKNIIAEKIIFFGNDAKLMAYLARPKEAGTYAGILVCHENRGLTPHIEDVTRRVAQGGYVGLAIDLLSREGGTGKFSDSTQITQILGNTNKEQFVQDFQAGFNYLQQLSYLNKDHIGMVGFCFGGGITWLMATHNPQLKAAVPFYGPNPPLEEVPKIQAPILAIYGELDQRINQDIPAIEEEMKKNNKIFEKIIYPGVNHAFHNDTTERYAPTAAKDAWMRTLSWFEKYLKV